MSKSSNTFILMAVPIFIISLIAYLIGFEKTWQLFGIPTVIPDFIDSRVITAGFESFKLGYDPLIANPAMPTGNQMNYPRIWQLLFYFDLNQNKTIYLAATCFTFYILGIFIICNTFENYMGKIIFLCIAFSPSALLGIERGNTDLIIFGIIALASQLFLISLVFSLFVLVIAFGLKLYPIFAITSFVIISNPKKIPIISSFLAASVLIYLIFMYDELILISNSTPRSFAMSYGKDVLYSALSYGLSFGESNLKIINLVSNLFYLSSSILIIIKSYQFSKSDSIKQDKKFEILFLAGSSIYCGTFLIGNNFEYRLIYLLMVIPFFYININKHSNNFIRKTSILIIVFILFTMWSMLINSYVDGRLLRIILFMINQSIQWIIYYVILYYLTLVVSIKLKSSSK